MSKPGFRRESLTIMGGLTLAGAAGLAAYAIINAWTTLTSNVVIAHVKDLGSDQHAMLGGQPMQLLWPYQVMVPVGQVPNGTRLLIQGADALAPLCWAVTVAFLGAFFRSAGTATTIFASGVRRWMRWLTGSIFVTAFLSPLLRLLGDSSLVSTLHWPGGGAHLAAWSIWAPLLVGYLCLGVQLILDRGARLQSELDEVI